MSFFVLLFTPFYAICPPFQEGPSGNPTLECAMLVFFVKPGKFCLPGKEFYLNYFIILFLLYYLG
jgi:hypothetical protein